MEDIIVYVIAAIVVISSIIRNYQKEAKKNKDRAATRPPRPAAQGTTPPPFSQQRTHTAEETTQQQTLPESYSGQRSVYTAIADLTSSINDNLRFVDDDEYALEKLKEYDFEDENRITATEDTKFELELNTPDNIKRAFAHSLIFDRKY